MKRVVRGPDEVELGVQRGAVNVREEPELVGGIGSDSRRLSVPRHPRHEEWFRFLVTTDEERG